MAIRTIESRLERMSVNDENEPLNGAPIQVKPKVPFKSSPYYQCSLIHQEELSFYSTTNHSADIQPEPFESSEICPPK